MHIKFPPAHSLLGMALLGLTNVVPVAHSATLPDDSLPRLKKRDTPHKGKRPHCWAGGRHPVRPVIHPTLPTE